MNRHERHIRNLCILAADIPNARAKVAASVVLNNRLVSVGMNSYEKTHPFQKKFSKNTSAIYVHSEVVAIRNALKRLPLKDLRRSTLYIARMKHTSEDSAHPDCWGLSKPCTGCMRAIATFGIKRTYYTTDQTGMFECF